MNIRGETSEPGPFDFPLIFFDFGKRSNQSRHGRMIRGETSEPGPFDFKLLDGFDNETRKILSLGDDKPGYLEFSKDGKTLFLQRGNGRLEAVKLGGALASGADSGGNANSALYRTNRFACQPASCAFCPSDTTHTSVASAIIRLPHHRCKAGNHTS